MKRTGGLWSSVCSFENLVQAAQHAARGKRHRDEVGHFFINLEPNLLRLQRELLDGSWKPGPFHVFSIREPKVRRICAAPFPDRVLHHALCGVVEPILESGYIFDSYACRKGKGTHRAIYRAQYYTRRYQYFLKLDIRKYFSSVDHKVAKSRIARKFKDSEILGLFGTIIDHGEPGRNSAVGLPIGNLTSQYLANLYLDAADHLVKEDMRVPGFIRYMDDMLLFSDSKVELWSELKILESFLNEKLKLEIKPGSVRVAPCNQGIPFLGFRVFPGTIRVLRVNWRRFYQKFKRRNIQYQKGEIGFADRELSIQSMVEYLRVGNTRNLRNTALNEGLSGARAEVGFKPCDTGRQL